MTLTPCCCRTCGRDAPGQLNWRGGTHDSRANRRGRRRQAERFADSRPRVRQASSALQHQAGHRLRRRNERVIVEMLTETETDSGRRNLEDEFQRGMVRCRRATTRCAGNQLSVLFRFVPDAPYVGRRRRPRGPPPSVALLAQAHDLILQRLERRRHVGGCLRRSSRRPGAGWRCSRGCRWRPVSLAIRLRMLSDDSGLVPSSSGTSWPMPMV